MNKKSTSWPPTLLTFLLVTRSAVRLRHHVNFKGPLSRLVCSLPRANFSNVLVPHLVNSFLGMRVLWLKCMGVPGGDAVAVCGAAGAGSSRGDLPSSASGCVSPAGAGGELKSSS